MRQAFFSPPQHAVFEFDSFQACGFPEAAGHFFGNDVERQDEEQAAEGGKGHAADDGDAHAAAGSGAGTAGKGQRQAADDGRKGRHEDWPQAKLGGDDDSFHRVDTLVDTLFGEFDDEDGVLGRQADDHDDANLHVDAVQEAAGIGVEQGRQLADDVFRADSPENPRRYGEQDGERHGPAFIEGSQAEEGEDQGHEQDFRRRTGRRAFFAALAGPFDGHPRRHDALGRFFGRCHGFTGTVAAGGAALDGDAADAVETGDRRRAGGHGAGQQRIEGNHFPRRRLDGNEIQTVCLRAIRRVGLDDDLVRPAELGEVIDRRTAEIGLERREDVGQFDAQILDFFTVYRIGHARCIGGIARADTG